MLRNFISALLVAGTGSIAACKPSVPEAAPPQAIASTAAAPSAVKAPGAAEADVSRIVADVMRQQYPGGYDEKHGCWAFSRESGDGRAEYCMRSHPPQWAGDEDARSLYFIASSANDISDDPRYAYGSVDPGLMGAFQVSIGPDGGWKLVAAEKAIDFGTAGACGCEDAKFVRLGRAYYGWMFASGGMWQGIVVSNHEIVAPHNGGFKNLSAIPEIREEAQDVRYTVAIVDSNQEADVFALKVEKLESDRKTGERTVDFDRDTWAYQTIGDF